LEILSSSKRKFWIELMRDGFSPSSFTPLIDASIAAVDEIRLSIASNHFACRAITPDMATKEHTRATRVSQWDQYI
jgi:hypothetical protein